MVTSGNVRTLALIDANNDGKNEIVCGCDNGTIKIYQHDSLLMEFFENSCVIQLAKIGKRLLADVSFLIQMINCLCVSDNTSLFAYTLDDGTVGVYNENIRLWRVKVS